MSYGVNGSLSSIAKLSNDGADAKLLNPEIS